MSDSSINPHPATIGQQRFSRVVIASLVLGTILIAVLIGLTRPSAPRSLNAARNAALRGDFVTAEKLAAQIPFDGSVQSREAILLAADAAERQRHYMKVVEYLDRLPDSDRAAEQARKRSGDILFGTLRQPWPAEKQFQRALSINPDNVEVHERLAYLLGLCASSWEAIPHRLQLLKQDRYDAIHLFLLCVGDTVLENSEELPAFLGASPDDPRVLLGAARAKSDEQDYAATKTLLRRAATVAPDMVEVHVKLGQLLQDNGSPGEMMQWNSQLPSNAEQHPGVWAVRATWAMRHEQADAAIRCFWECVVRDPNHERSNYQLSQLLVARGDSGHAEPYLQRSKLLTDYLNAVKIAYTGSDDSIALRAATVAEQLGLNWEAAAWYRLLQKKKSSLKECTAGLQRLTPSFTDMPLARTKPESGSTSQVDLSRYPLPQWSEITNAPLSIPNRPLTQPSTVLAFSEDAQELGIRFQYHNGVPLGTTSHRMFEFSGGGVAVLDYDRDGYPDTYFTQGCSWPAAADSNLPSDHLFRNQRGILFDDITVDATIRETGFSQGATSGDYDADGFPDLYVANIGHNTLFHNNGDGTFTDVTTPSGTAGEDRWSTSAAIADLNADGLPDLYVVNYVSGNDLFDRVCHDANGKPRSCSPRHFSAAQDQCWLNVGDGTFREITAESGLEVPDGKGLGIVVGDFDQTRRLSIFVANDAVPNFFFVNHASPGSAPRFTEQAMISGLAVDQDGRPQACMGVAAGDADGDGLLDLFVTNFFNECNTFYRQMSPGTFEDATRSAQLYDISLKMVGFGTQFLDIDLNGDLDLVIANGDVDDLRDSGRDYTQRPQCVWNTGTGTFREIQNPSLGSYFQNKWLGRGLARLDWNRDGREDFAVSHLDKPAALLTNRSEAGNYLRLHLVGTASAREPVGATVTCVVGTHRHVRQLTAGDGYMASNERVLTFGLGRETQIDRIEIRWPSGTSSEFRGLTASTEYIIVEQSRNPIELSHKADSAGPQ